MTWRAAQAQARLRLALAGAACGLADGAEARRSEAQGAPRVPAPLVKRAAQGHAPARPAPRGCWLVGRQLLGPKREVQKLRSHRGCTHKNGLAAYRQPACTVPHLLKLVSLQSARQL